MDRVPILYDGDCRFCRACVGWIERRDRAGKLHPVPYQEASNPPLMPQMLARAKHSVLVIAPDGRVHTAGRAVLFVLAEIGWAPWLTRLAARPPRGDTVADRVVDVIGRASRAMDRDPLLSAALVTAVSSPDPAVSACQLEVTRAISATLLVAMDGVDEERRQGVVKVLSHVWFSSLVGWVSGWSNVGSVGDELETAARLLLRE